MLHICVNLAASKIKEVILRSCTVLWELLQKCASPPYRCPPNPLTGSIGNGPLTRVSELFQKVMFAERTVASA